MANSDAFNNLPADPMAQQASWIPNEPIKVSGPSGLSLAAGIAGAAVSGISTGMSYAQAERGVTATEALAPSPSPSPAPPSSRGAGYWSDRRSYRRGGR